MPFCPNGHGSKTGQHCDQCGAELVDTPPAAGDSVRVRSPQAHATASPTFVLPGGTVETRPALVKCPKCGKRNLESATFDCQGDCGCENLCENHFNDEFEVCHDCARGLRGEVQAEAERQKKLETDLASWCQRAAQAEAQVAGLNRRGEQVGEALEQARAELRQAQERVRSLEQELAGETRRAEQAETSAAALTERSQIAETDLAARTTELRQAEERIRLLDKDVMVWRRRAEEAEQQQPIWQQIGIEMIPIPAGPFIYSGSALPLDFEAFEIAKTPVTNVQFAAFTEATGYITTAQQEGTGRAWTESKIQDVVGAYWRHPRGAESHLTGKDNHPVVQVSWEDAQAFCRWAGLLLPTDQEWEKAARGGDRRRYPWGDAEPTEECCNFNLNIGNTTPVHQYPDGASPYGLLDMTGNVWEWCEDWFDSQHNTRVLRGGSWRTEAGDLVTTSHSRTEPRNRGDLIGFRCARSLDKHN